MVSYVNISCTEDALRLVQPGRDLSLAVKGTITFHFMNSLFSSLAVGLFPSNIVRTLNVP